MKNDIDAGIQLEGQILQNTCYLEGAGKGDMY